MTDTRRIWFERGAWAGSLYWPDLVGVYICPQCSTPYERGALDARTLTREHVPPESLGGKRLVLTCQRCNSTSGSALDAAMLAHDDRIDFAFRQTRPGRWVEASTRVEGKHVTLKAEANEGEYHFYAVPAASHSRAVELLQRGGGPLHLNLEFPVGKDVPARVNPDGCARHISWRLRRLVIATPSANRCCRTGNRSRGQTKPSSPTL